MKRVQYSRLLLVAAVSSLSGCSSSVESTPTPNEVVAQAIEASLSDSGRSQLGTNWRDSVQVRSESSAVISGLVYQSGTYRPPRTHDLIYSALAASAGGRTTELRSPADWVEAVKRTGETFDSEREATGACAELIRMVGPGRGLRQPPVVYFDSSSLRDPEVMLSVDRRAVLSSATPPQVKRTQDGWQVNIWALEVGRLVEYDCSLSSTPEVRASLKERRTEPGNGLAG